jgi:Ca2+-binding RTX toxin-like protein
MLLGARGFRKLPGVEGERASCAGVPESRCGMRSATGDTEMANFTGDAGDNNFVGTSDADTFDLSQGGSDTATGLDGDDIFNMGGAFDASDQLDGGNGNDVVNLNGDYNLIFGATTMVGVEQVNLTAGHSYSFVLNDATTAANARLQISGSSLGTTDALVVDGSGETDGKFTLLGGAGNDALTGGQSWDSLAGASGNNTLAGNGGRDVLSVTGTGTNSLDGGDGDDRIIGGTGHNTIVGGTGDDTISSKGIDTIDGGDGHDKAFFTLFSAVNFQSAGSQAFASIGSTSVKSVESFAIGIFGGAGSTLTMKGGGDDSLSATAGDNNFYGAGGDDRLVAGGAGTNQLAGNAGDDFITGGPGGHNTLLGGDGNDIILSRGIDRIDGGTGFDHAKLSIVPADGGTFDFSDPNVRVIIGQTTVIHVESFEITGGSANETLFMGAGDDVINTNEGNDTVQGAAGDDTLADDVGQNLLAGGAGDDVLGNSLVPNPSVTISSVNAIDGGEGNDIAVVRVGQFNFNNVSFHLTDPSGVTTFNGLGTSVTNVESIYFFGSSGTYNITSGAGDDQLNSMIVGSHANFHGGDGDDILTFDDGSGYGGAGDDIITLQDRYTIAGDEIFGGDGNDVISTKGSVAIDGGGGIDSVTIDRSGEQSALTFLQTNSGTSATLNTENGPISVVNVENITLIGGSGVNTFTTGKGNDHLVGGTNADVLNGGGGDDLLETGGGGDSADGGSGNDRAIVNYQNSGVDLVFDFNGPGNATTIAATGDSFIHIEAFTIFGGQGNDQFTAGNGDDVLNGGGGSNTLNGMLGDDTLSAAAGINTFIGGEGNDTVVLIGFAEGDGYTASLETGVATGYGVTQDSFSGIENITGGGGNDVLTGDAGNNILDGGLSFDQVASDLLSGGDGDDTLIIEYLGSGSLDGGAGNDTAIVDARDQGPIKLLYTPTESGVFLDSGTLIVPLINIENFQITAGVDNDHMIAGPGNDVLDGGAGKDLLSGDAGDDTLIGGIGADSLDGGDGHDTFVYNAIAESTGSNVDTIKGYDATQDHFVLPVNVTGIDAAFTGGSFEDLEGTVTAAALQANHAVIVTFATGVHAGDTFLVVDGNGVAGYQWDRDLVVDLANGKHLDLLSTANFTMG